MSDIDVLVDEAVATAVSRLQFSACHKLGQVTGLERYLDLPDRPDYPLIRAALKRRLVEAGSREELGGAAVLLAAIGDQAALVECGEGGCRLPESMFFLGFKEYCRTWLADPLLANHVISDQRPFGVEMTVNFAVGSFLQLRRPAWPQAVAAPAAEWRPGIEAFAADLDPVTGHILVGLCGSDQLAVLDGDTLQPVKMIDFPGGGVRGVGVLPALRRGFVTTQFHQSIQVIDLDRLDVVATVGNLPHRPERIAVDAATGALATGGLGDDLVWPCDATYFNERDKVTPTTGPRDNALAILDGERAAITAVLPTGRRPTAIAISPELVVAGNFYDNSLTIYRRDALDRPVTVALDIVPNLTVNFPSPSQAVAQCGKVLRPLGLEGIAIARRRGKILVTGYDIPVLMVVDVASARLERIIPVGNRAFDVDLDDAERFAYVNCRFDNQVSVVDLDAGAEVARLQGGPSLSDLRVAGDRLLVAQGEGLTVHHIQSKAG